MAEILTFMTILAATALCYFAVGRLAIDRRERLPLSRMRTGDVIHTVRRAVGVLTVRSPSSDASGHDRVAKDDGISTPDGRGRRSQLRRERP